MSEEFLRPFEARKITDWKVRDAHRPFPKELAGPIGRGEIPCPVCKNGTQIDVLVSQSDPTKLFKQGTRCLCNFYKQYFADIKAKVPLRYQEGSLANLKPSSRSMLTEEAQAALLKELRENPQSSYAFFGPAGTSKTTFALGLYKHALFLVRKAAWEGPDCWDKDSYCWRITAKQLLEEHHDYVTNRSRTDDEGNFRAGAKVPTVTRQKIDKAVAKGYRPRLFLEELDKVKSTQFRLDTLFEIIDGLYEQQGQLVINSNMTLAEFSSAFGSAFERRVAEMCVVKDFFEVPA